MKYRTFNDVASGVEIVLEEDGTQLYDVTVPFEKMGNFLYGYFGNAVGIPKSILTGGSIGVSGILGEHNDEDVLNEFNDIGTIIKGYEYYEKQN